MSKLINKSRLEQFATALWTKIKGRYDDAFINAEITESTVEEKKLKFTKIKGGNKVEVNLKDYARLTDKNDFEKDVTSNIGMTDNTLKLGEINGNENRNRTSGHRGITSKSFVDGYIDHITVLADETQSEGDSTNWTVWAVKKEANRAADRVHKRYSKTANIKSTTINGVAYKTVDLPINESFSEEVYFILRCEGRPYKVVNLRQENQSDDVVNVSVAPGDTGSSINWERVQNNIAVMFLVGRESIKSLSEKLDKVNSDSSTYVKHSECTVQGGNASYNGKVVKLGTDGKLHESLMPSIAINEYIEVTTFDHTTLQGKRYENGDVVVVTSGGQVVKRYLCINKLKNPDNLTEGFVELNSKDGVVTSVNALRGDINLALVAEEARVKLDIVSGGQTVTKEIEVITAGEIDAIIAALPTT